MSERFEDLAVQIERMEARRMPKDEQIDFAEKALASGRLSRTRRITSIREDQSHHQGAPTP